MTQTREVNLEANLGPGRGRDPRTEDESDQHEARIVDSRRRRNRRRAVKQHDKVDVPDPRLRSLPRPQPDGDREDGADAEGVQGGVIQRESTELTFRSDETPAKEQRRLGKVTRSLDWKREIVPENRSGEEDFGSRAEELVLVGGHADVGGGLEEPLLDGHLYETREEHNDDLDCKNEEQKLLARPDIRFASRPGLDSPAKVFRGGILM